MNRYKITLSSNTVYKEIELAPDAQQVKVGTGVDFAFAKNFSLGRLNCYS